MKELGWINGDDDDEELDLNKLRKENEKKINTTNEDHKTTYNPETIYVPKGNVKKKHKKGVKTANQANNKKKYKF